MTSRLVRLRSRHCLRKKKITLWKLWSGNVQQPFTWFQAFFFFEVYGECISSESLKSTTSSLISWPPIGLNYLEIDWWFRVGKQSLNDTFVLNSQWPFPRQTFLLKLQRLLQQSGTSWRNVIFTDSWNVYGVLSFIIPFCLYRKVRWVFHCIKWYHYFNYKVTMTNNTALRNSTRDWRSKNFSKSVRIQTKTILVYSTPLLCSQTEYIIYIIIVIVICI